MSPILSTLLFAAAAAADFTTTIWQPAYPNSEQDSIGLKGSIVAAEKDRVTMQLDVDRDHPLYTASDYEGVTELPTYTLIGASSFEHVTSQDWTSGVATIKYGCTIGSNSRPICVYSTNGPAIRAGKCTSISEYPDFVEPNTDYTFVTPSWCSDGASTIPESEAVSTVSVGGASIQTYQVIVTAGEEKLSATTGASPTTPGVSPTGASTRTSPTGASPISSPTGSPTGTPPEEQTTNAGPMVTVAPVLAGLGAFVAAIAL